MKRIEIRLDDVPSYGTVFQYIRYKTDIAKRFAKLDKGRKDDLIELSFSYPIDQLDKQCQSAVREFGTYGWLSKQGRSKSSYRSLSLVFNPELDDPQTNQYNSTLGSSKIDAGKYFYGSLKTFIGLRGRIKDSYYDSYGFNTPNLPCKDNLGDFTKTFKCTQIRSRLSIIRANAVDSLSPDYLLHKDEPVYENLRINIPLTETHKHFLQIGGHDYVLKRGKAYTWNTNKPHRVFGVSTEDRANLVLGFSPWFDYIPEERKWVSNAYYGELHPLDMVKQGLVIPTVSTATEPV